MYLLREIFVAKPGQASKLAKLFKKMPGMPGAKIMTDMVGPYNTVVMEMEIKSLSEWEKQMEEYKSGKPDPNMDKLDEETKEAMSHYHEMYLTGRREIYQIW
jgi:hypothetical protein